MADGPSVYSILRTLIESGFTTSPLYWENEMEREMPPVTASYVYVSIEPALLATAHQIGDGITYRVTGSVVATICTPKGTGQLENYTLAEAFLSVLRSFNDGIVHCYGHELLLGGREPERGNYYVTTVLMSFWYYQS